MTKKPTKRTIGKVKTLIMYSMSWPKEKEAKIFGGGFSRGAFSQGPYGLIKCIINNTAAAIPANWG